MTLISPTAVSTILRSATALPKPWFKQIFSMRGTCMEEVYSNCFFKAGAISSAYCVWSLGM